MSRDPRRSFLLLIPLRKERVSSCCAKANFLFSFFFQNFSTFFIHAHASARLLSIHAPATHAHCKVRASQRELGKGKKRAKSKKKRLARLKPHRRAREDFTRTVKATAAIDASFRASVKNEKKQSAFRLIPAREDRVIKACSGEERKFKVWDALHIPAPR